MILFKRCEWLTESMRRLKSTMQIIDDKQWPRGGKTWGHVPEGLGPIRMQCLGPHCDVRDSVTATDCNHPSEWGAGNKPVMTQSKLYTTPRLRGQGLAYLFHLASLRTHGALLPISVPMEQDFRKEELFRGWWWQTSTTGPDHLNYPAQLRM